MSKRDWIVEFRENLLHGILQFWIDHGIDGECGVDDGFELDAGVLGSALVEVGTGPGAVARRRHSRPSRTTR